MAMSANRVRLADLHELALMPVIASTFRSTCATHDKNDGIRICRQLGVAFENPSGTKALIGVRNAARYFRDMGQSIYRIDYNEKLWISETRDRYSGSA
jgi:hypothetical protein